MEDTFLSKQTREKLSNLLPDDSIIEKTMCRQIDDDDENLPLNYYINNDLHRQIGREEFCLATGLRFGVENREENNTQANFPFRRRVFLSHLDWQPITGIDIANAIVGPT
nr:hypothetical protein [Tanacetum cinerariifolium]